VPRALRPLVRDMPNHQCTRRHADDPTCDLEAVIHFEFGQAEESYPRTSGEGRAGHESGPPLLIVSADAWEGRLGACRDTNHRYCELVVRIAWRAVHAL
jgi:hypothetical protein